MTVELLGEQLAMHDIGILIAFVFVALFTADARTKYVNRVIDLPLRRRAEIAGGVLTVSLVAWKYIESGLNGIIESLANDAFGALIVAVILGAVLMRTRR